MPFQLQRPSLRWLAVVAKQTVLLQVFMQNPKLILAPIFASEAVSVRMIRTHRTSKMQYGNHIGPGANENIVFLIAYTISFPKMYSFNTFQRTLAEILMKTCFMAAIL